MKLKRGRISVSFTLGYCKKIIFVRVRFFEVADLSLDLKELRSQFKIIKKYLYISWNFVSHEKFTPRFYFSYCLNLLGAIHVQTERIESTRCHVYGEEQYWTRYVVIL